MVKRARVRVAAVVVVVVRTQDTVFLGHGIAYQERVQPGLKHKWIPDAVEFAVADSRHYEVTCIQLCNNLSSTIIFPRY